MEPKGRARYNSLMMHGQPGKPWQVCDYRQLDKEELWNTLGALGVSLDYNGLAHHVLMGTESPEAMAELLMDPSVDEEKREVIYLILFELWRRLFPEYGSVSIVADAIDHLSVQYEVDPEAHSEELFETFGVLGDLIDESLEAGSNPKDLWQEVSSFLAIDLEHFLYAYISDLIDAGEEADASELVEMFDIYVQEPLWFDFLKCRLVYPTDPHEGCMMMRRLMDALHEETMLDLSFEVLHDLITGGNLLLFNELYLQTLAQLKTEGDLQEMIKIAKTYYALFDYDTEAEAMDSLLEMRGDLSLETPLKESDATLLLLKSQFHVIASVETNRMESEL